jgi:hypothetical protein
MVGGAVDPQEARALVPLPCANRIPLNNLSPKTLRSLIALLWCSRVDLRSEDAALGVVSGPAHMAAD